jgi:DNA-binding NtrC family response regulator
MEYYFKKKSSTFIALDSAEEALERLKDETFDVVICDYHLPGMNGLTFFEVLEKIHPGRVKILVTAIIDTDLIKEAKKIGIHNIIQKPYNSHDIEIALTRL